jgi:hypothetical protein
VNLNVVVLRSGLRRLTRAVPGSPS